MESKKSWPAGWYVVGRGSDVGLKPIRCLRFGEPFVFWRDAEGRIQAHKDSCPHRKARLSQGRVLHGRLECPFHGFQFDGSGTCVHAPELDRGLPGMRADTWPIEERDGWLLAKPPGIEADVSPWRPFEDLTQGFLHAYQRVRWATHFTRCVENQLDYSHLPFVHKNSIGRLVKVGDHPHIDVFETHIGWSGQKRHDGLYGIEFRFPNIWINRIAPKFAVSVAFVPETEHTTEIYLGTHQGFWLKGGQALTKMMQYFNLKILKEDQSIVEQQVPQDTREAASEMLLPSDKAIRHFRSWFQTSTSA